MLENEIKRLNTNIEKLIAVLETKSVATEQTSTPEVEDEQGYTTDDIKSMALAISRAERSKQKDIKAKLAEHNAKVATDLTGDALQAVGEWLADLKKELGV